MFGANLQVMAVIAALALGGLAVATRAVWKAGYAARAAEQAETVEKARKMAADAAEYAARRETARLAAERENARLAAELEDLANADPVVAPGCFPADRVRRLNLR